MANDTERLAPASSRLVASATIDALRSVFTSAPACICVLRGPEHVFDFANPQYRALLRGRDIEGLPVRLAIPELEGQGYFELLDRVYESGEPFLGNEMPASIERGDGSVEEVFFDLVYQPMLGSDGKPEAIIAFGFDVTRQVLARRGAEELARERKLLVEQLAQAVRLRDESLSVLAHDIAERKKVETELELEREKLRSLLLDAPLAVVLYEGPEHVTRFSNPAHDEMTGGRIVLGVPLLESLPELAGSPVLRSLDEVYQTGRNQSVREMYTPLLRDGRLQDSWYDVTWQAVRDGDGSVEAVLVSAIEVTEHVLARRRVEAVNQVTNAITSNATLGLIMLDARQHCTFMNPAAQAITGFCLDEVQDRPLHYFVHHSRPEGTPYPMDQCPIDRAVLGKNQERGEDVFVHKDGHFYPVAFTASPLVAAGKLVGTVIELRDTTHEKAAQQERERMLAELRAAVATRDEFLSIASHELRTPLTALDLQLQTLRRWFERAPHGADPDKSRRKLDMAMRQVNRLASLIEGLLDVSRIATGRFVLHVEEFDLARFVREVVDRFEDEAQRAHSLITLSAPASAVGRWDKARLDQLLTNLLSNALKYGPGQPIEVRLVASDDRVSIDVHDRGIGIAPDDCARIFERFERAVPSKHYGGLGLGLYIARQIVSAHAGSIGVRSEQGQGATFTVSMPRYADPGSVR